MSNKETMSGVHKTTKERNVCNKEAINWELSIKLANNKQDAANRMLDMYVSDLQDVRATLKKLYKEKNYKELRDQAHRLRSASCYCGVPKIKQLTQELENRLEYGAGRNISIIIRELHENIDKVINSYECGDYRCKEQT